MAAFLELSDQYDVHGRRFVFSQSMRLPSDEAVGAFMGILGDGVCAMYERTCRERACHQLFELQWILLAASVSLIDKTHTRAATNSSNH